MTTTTTCTYNCSRVELKTTFPFSIPQPGTICRNELMGWCENEKEDGQKKKRTSFCLIIMVVMHVIIKLITRVLILHFFTNSQSVPAKLQTRLVEERLKLITLLTLLEFYVSRFLNKNFTTMAWHIVHQSDVFFFSQHVIAVYQWHMDTYIHITF